VKRRDSTGHAACSRYGDIFSIGREMKDDNPDLTRLPSQSDALCPRSVKLLDDLKNLAVWRALQPATESHPIERRRGERSRRSHA